jgi:outer membrane biosynthesis protein TonB
METEEVQDEPMEEATEEPQEDMAEEPEPEESTPETTEDEAEEEVEEKQEKPEKKEDTKKPESKKEKAAKKIVKKMGDKGRYDSTNQLKTLIVMQVLGDTKTFFESQKELNDREGFFTEFMLPDTQIENNNLAQYYLFAGSEGLINEMIDSQWQQK